jgi:hypothetical protein
MSGDIRWQTSEAGDHSPQRRNPDRAAKTADLSRGGSGPGGAASERTRQGSMRPLV